MNLFLFPFRRPLADLAGSSTELIQDLGIFREAPLVMFRKDEFSVDFDIENPAGTRNEFGLDVMVLLDSGRQTGGLWPIVSTRAVRNSDDH